MILHMKQTWQSYPKGDVVDFDTATGRRLMELGFAEFATMKQVDEIRNKMVQHAPHDKAFPPASTAQPPQRHDGGGPGASESVPLGAGPQPDQKHQNPGSPGKGMRK